MCQGTFKVYDNNAPYRESVVEGPKTSVVEEEVTYEFTAFDPGNDKLNVTVFFNDGE